jgi:hypothetical protein
MFLINRQFTQPGSTPFGDRPDSFPSPAAEPAYDFTVEVHYRKTVLGRHRTSLWLDERESGRTSGIVRETARQISREYSILEPGRAEQAINEELDRRLAEGGRASRPAWSARVEVAAPDEVREMMRRGLQERYQIESRARADELRLDKTELLRRRWAGFLNDAAKNPTAPHALTLAEKPEDFAQVLRAMLDERRNDVGEWLDLVTRIVEAHQSAGVLDLVVESDSVLRKTLEMMGIELPALDPDAPLVPDKGDR